MNGAHVFETAALMLAAFLIGAVIGTLARRFAVRRGTIVQPAVVAAAAAAEASPLVVAPTIVPVANRDRPKTPAERLAAAAGRAVGEPASAVVAPKPDLQPSGVEALPLGAGSDTSADPVNPASPETGQNPDQSGADAASPAQVVADAEPQDVPAEAATAVVANGDAPVVVASAPAEATGPAAEAVIAGGQAVASDVAGAAANDETVATEVAAAATDAEASLNADGQSPASEPMGDIGPIDQRVVTDAVESQPASDESSINEGAADLAAAAAPDATVPVVLTSPEPAQSAADETAPASDAPAASETDSPTSDTPASAEVEGTIAEPVEAAHQGPGFEPSDELPAEAAAAEAPSPGDLLAAETLEAATHSEADRNVVAEAAPPSEPATAAVQDSGVSEPSKQASDRTPADLEAAAMKAIEGGWSPPSAPKAVASIRPHTPAPPEADNAAPDHPAEDDPDLDLAMSAARSAVAAAASAAAEALEKARAPGDEADSANAAESAEPVDRT